VVKSAKKPVKKPHFDEEEELEVDEESEDGEEGEEREVMGRVKGDLFDDSGDESEDDQREHL
jgi:hypothetical protein